MSNWSLKTLEFHHIKEMIKEYADSEIGKEILSHLIPVVEKDKVSFLLQETMEGLHLLRLKGEVSLFGIYDFRSYLIRASKLGMLHEDECLEIGSTLSSGRRIKSVLRQVEKEVNLFPILKDLTESIHNLDELREHIEQTIDPEGSIRDEASSNLKTIRRQKAALKQRIHQTLSHILRNPHYLKMIQEAIITQRNNRYVLPVKQEYRAEIKGVVHDQSSSGATIFIEPDAVFQLNNQLRELELEEEKERERILTELTLLISQHEEVLRENLDILTRIDVILAKAKWGREFKAVCPKISKGQTISIKNARHPLIPRNQVVPIDIFLKEHLAMIITGPNAGGKTVILKTVGLFALMMQCGIPIPCEEDSMMPIFSGVFADIGDEQSIEQSLSTFSGHLTNIIHILNKLDHQSLIILDELGAGTDPTEGTALATSILEYIIKKGCVVITTTHYSELKYFAYNNPYAINANVEFDTVSLLPTYRLIIGTPGSSNAFNISERLGLPAEIIKGAKSYLSGEENTFEKGIRDLEETRKEIEKEKEKIAVLRSEADKKREDLQKQLMDWENKKNAIEEKTRMKAKSVIAQAKQEVENAFKLLEKVRTSPEAIKEHHLIEAKAGLQKAIPEAKVKVLEEVAAKFVSNEEIEVGDDVFVSRLNQEGTIIEKLGENKYLVHIGSLKMKLERESLEKRTSKKPTLSPKPVYTVSRSTNTISSEIHLRGKVTEEAIAELDKYIDDATIAGLKKISIVHGKGTGILRKAVHNYLKGHRSVFEYRLGHHGEGGYGVTVVDLN